VAVEFGIHLGLNTVGDPAPDRLAYYRRCLEIGDAALKALWVSDHLQKGDAPVFEAWTTLSNVAALAPSYRVGNMVLGQSYRNPALLPKMAATFANPHRAVSCSASAPGGKRMSTSPTTTRSLVPANGSSNSARLSISSARCGLVRRRATKARTTRCATRTANHDPARHRQSSSVVKDRS